MASSSSSATSSRPPVMTYGLAASGPGVQGVLLSVALNTVVNILRLRTADRASTDYGIEQIKEPYERVHICSQARLNKEKKTVQLGYDQKYGLWYTSYKDREKFHKWFQALLQPLTEAELRQVNPQGRGAIALGQEDVLDLLRLLKFTLPVLELQSSDPEAYIALPLRGLPGQVKKIEGVSIESCSQFFADLLKGANNNKGVFLGHDHGSLTHGMTELLVDQMGALAAAGVRHIYEEFPAHAAFEAFERFNLDPSDDGTELHKLLEQKHCYLCAERMKIYRAAKEHGIQIWPIDGYMTEEMRASAQNRLRLGDGIMTRNIEYYSSKLKEGERFVTLNGYAHHGIATALDIPYIHVKLDPSREAPAAAPPPAPVRSEQEIQAGEAVVRVNQQLFAQLVEDDEAKVLAKGPGFILSGEDDDRVLAKVPDFTLSYGLHYADKKVGIQVMKV